MIGIGTLFEFRRFRGSVRSGFMPEVVRGSGVVGKMAGELNDHHGGDVMGL